MSAYTFAASKLALCIRLARECSRCTWQETKEHRAEYLRMKAESVADAREWREELKEAQQ